MAMRHGPDDVFRTERSVAAKEHLRIGRAHGLGIDLRHVPFVEFDSAVALDPGEGVFLADRHQHVVAHNGLVRFACWNETAPAGGVVLSLYFLEGDTGKLAVVVNERRRHHEIQDRNVFVNGVFFFPGRSFHFLEPGTHDHLDVLAAETARGSASVHRGVAAAEHDHAFADLFDVAERYAGEPIDADVNIAGSFLAAGDLQLAATRRARADKDRGALSSDQLPHA